MQISHSRVECFEGCKFKYRLRYIDKLLTLPPDNADNALILGHAMHTGIEQGLNAALDEYRKAFPIWTDEQINEEIKLEYWIPRARALLPPGEYEVPILTGDFVGYIDLLAPVTMFHEAEVPNLYDLYDFKYTSNGRNYAHSPQLHLYKYFFEKTHPGTKIRNLIYCIIPKVSIKQKKGENLRAFRGRIESELSKKEISTIPVEYDPGKVIDFLLSTKGLLECKEYPKEPQFLCSYCEYQEYCQKGVNYMLLPKNERRNIETIKKRVVWLYGAPFVGKTYFANQFPDPLMLNTDGNIRFIDAPYLPIKDEVTVKGRLTERKLAWEIFKEIITELERKENDFKTLVVDLLEDCHEACRLYMYDQMGISHESDDSFRAWDKVRTEFLSTMRKLCNLPYENIILISHEDTAKDITKKGGDKLTAIKPNIQDKVANKVAGMVDIVARVVADGDNRVLSFKNNEVIFGGGRLAIDEKEIPLDYQAFLEIYDEANKNAVSAMHTPTKAAPVAYPKRSSQRNAAPKENVEEAAPDQTVTVPAIPADTQTDEAALAEAAKEADAEAAESPDHPNHDTDEVTPDTTDPKPTVRTRKKRDA